MRDHSSEPGTETDDELGKLLCHYGYNPRARIVGLILLAVVWVVGLFFGGLGYAFIVTQTSPLGTPNPQATTHGATIIGGSLVGIAFAFVLYRAWRNTTSNYGIWLHERGFRQRFSLAVHECRWDEIYKIRYIVSGGPIVGSLVETEIVGLEIHRYQGNPLALNIKRLDYRIFPELVKHVKKLAAKNGQTALWEKGFSFDLLAQ